MVRLIVFIRKRSQFNEIADVFTVITPVCMTYSRRQDLEQGEQSVPKGSRSSVVCV